MQIGSGTVAPIYLLQGDDDIEKSALGHEFEELVDEGLRPFNVERIHAGEITTGDKLVDVVGSLVAAARTLPMMAPGMVAAALFAFAVSFDQFVISYFLAAPGVTTLPVEIYTAIRKGYTPEINAISTVIIVISMGLMLLVSRLYRFSGER